MDKLTLDDLLAEMGEVLGQMDGEAVAALHNSICLAQVRYAGDSMWERAEEQPAS